MTGASLFSQDPHGTGIEFGRCIISGVELTGTMSSGGRDKLAS